jgi:hypothetical protein
MFLYRKEKILSHFGVTYKTGFWMGIIDHTHVVTTTKYNILAYSHITNHFTPNLLSVLSVFKSHTKSSWHSLIPSTADSLNSDLRQLYDSTLSSRTVAYCRQPASTVTPGNEPTGTHGHIFVQCQVFCFFLLSLFLL